MARRALGPATLAGVQAVEAALTSSDRSLLVACSGGSDSLALAVAAAEVARRRVLPYAGVVVDHGLQTDSATVAALAAEQLRKIGVTDVSVVPVVVAAGPEGPEAAARRARYATLGAVAEARDATVLLGHTLDDQAETVLLGLARGSGTRSLAGMAARTGRYLRPFLPLRRSVGLAICAEAGLTPWSDPSNADPRYARARVRHRVLPVMEAELGPGVTEALARTAALARLDSDVLEALAAQADPATDSLACAELSNLPVAVRSRVVRRWLLRRGAREVTAQHVDAVSALVLDWHGQRVIDLPGVSVERQDGRLWCRPTTPRAE